MNDLHTFYDLTCDDPPSALLRRAVALLPHKGDALDLGCGAGRDTRFLLAQGFQVTAVDVRTEALAYLRATPDPRLQVVQASFEHVVFASYDLINASWSLPFAQPDTFAAVMQRIKDALRCGGIFTGQLFGVNDSWNVPSPPTAVTFVTRERVTALLADLHIVELTEQDEDGTTATGTTKHWHVFHVIVQRSR